MAGIRVEAPWTSAMIVIFVVVLLFAPLTVARPVASGWDLARSSGSSDTTLWRKFSTPAQATRYHRLLLDLEKENTRRTQEVTVAVEGKVADATPLQDFNTMDYAIPRSNDPGSSDSWTPPAP